MDLCIYMYIHGIGLCMLYTQHTTLHSSQTHIVGAVAVVDVDLALAVAKEDDLAVRRPLGMG